MIKGLIFAATLLSSISIWGQDTAVDQKLSILLNQFSLNPTGDSVVKELRTLAYSIQNRAFAMDETYRDYNGALKNINQALLIWTAVKDTLNLANLLKYKGYLQGRLHSFAAAKSAIQKAIELFKLYRKENGVAVSLFDLSKVYEFAMHYDSSIHFANEALKYWITTQDTTRMVIVNNQLMNVLCKKGELKKASITQERSALMVSRFALHWQPQIDFYYLSASVYKQLQNQHLSAHYENLYREKVQSLKDKKIIARSTYY